MCVLALLRIILCLLPQNEWTNYRQPLFWGILRNVPFVMLGAMLVVLFAREVRRTADKPLRFLPLAMVLPLHFIFRWCSLRGKCRFWEC